MCFWAFSPSLTSLLVLPDSNNCERNQAINMPYFRNLRFGNSGFEFKDGHKALTIKVFSTILSLTEAQNHTYLFTKRRFRKQSFRKPALFFPPFNARRIFPTHDTNNPTNSLRKDGSPPSSSHACRCSGDKRPSPCCTRPQLSPRRPAIARPASYPKGACPKRRHNACRRRAERICCLP